jgi:Cytochrome C oxidase, cbb3-type, subunit III
MTKRTPLRALVLAASCLTSVGCGGEDESAKDSVTGDAVRGGALYDAYWLVPGVMSSAAPTTNHPLWASRPDSASNTRMGPDTWRCKECHGWDYKGVSGRYGSGSHATGFPGVLGTTSSASAIAALLADPTGHNYGAVLSETDRNDLAAFIATSLFDTATLIDASGAFIGGDTVAGKVNYDGGCAVCHGADGLNTTPTGSGGGFEDFPGFIANDNPWEFIHKVRFGQPGTVMTAQEATLDRADLANLGAYCQTLPMATP